MFADILIILRKWLKKKNTMYMNHAVPVYQYKLINFSISVQKLFYTGGAGGRVRVRVREGGVGAEGRGG